MRKRTKRKYRNEPVTYKGMKFDSKKERDRFIELEEWENIGLIHDLQRQVKFEIQPHFRNSKGEMIRAIDYKADFTYYRDGKFIVEDVKSKITAQDKAYKLKKKLLAYKGIEIEEFI